MAPSSQSLIKTLSGWEVGGPVPEDKSLCAGFLPVAKARGPGGGGLGEHLVTVPNPVTKPPSWPWQVCNPRSEVLHGQHSPHTDPVQERSGEVRTTKAPGMWRGQVCACGLLGSSSHLQFTEPSLRSHWVLPAALGSCSYPNFTNGETEAGLLISSSDLS